MGQGEDNLAHRNVAEFNEIRRCNLETNDSGAFEMLGYERRDSGNVIRYNLILDSVGMIATPEGKILTPYFTWGVYLDDMSSGTTVYGNIIARTVNGGCCIHGGQNNVFENNVFVEGHEHQVRLQPHGDFMRGNKFVRNVVAYSRPEAHLIFSWANQPNMFSECDHNLYWLKGADQHALTYSRSWAADSSNQRVRLKAECDRLEQEVALRGKEIRIKDVRMAQIDPQRRPHYPATERMAILELRASRGWSLEQAAKVFLLTADTISSWVRRFPGSARLPGTRHASDPGQAQVPDLRPGEAVLVPGLQVLVPQEGDQAAVRRRRSTWQHRRDRATDLDAQAEHRVADVGTAATKCLSLPKDAAAMGPEFG
jgi:hypothetical protein